MNLADFIRDHQDDILEDWEAFASTLRPAADELDRAELRDYAAGILASIVSDMKAGEEPASDAHVDQLTEPGPVVTDAAQRHAADRLSQKFTLEQMVAEFRSLRASVIRRWEDRRGVMRPSDVDDERHFHDAVDKSLESTVGWYDQRLREVEAARTRLVADLQAGERRFRALVNASTFMVFRMSPDWSEMQLLNAGGTLLEADPPTRNWMETYIHPDDQSSVRLYIREAVKNQEVFRVEHRVRRGDGSMGWAVSRAVPLFDEQGRLVEWFGASSDVTGRRETEERLREADRSKNEFLAVLGHELRNPLAPLRTSVDLLEQARRKPELIESLRPMMNRQLTHLVRLVDDLLDLSRISRGQIDLQPTPLDLNAPVEAAIDQMNSLVAERQHALRVHLSEMPLPVLGDFERLTQVIANLLSNAVKYMDPGGTIHLRSEPENGAAVIYVRDTGYGIPPKRLDDVFKLFSQVVEHRQQTGGGGLGVGLALSRQLMEMHGGSIEARSKGLGFGSEFVVRMPMSADLPGVEVAAASDAAAVLPRRVLVVEDNPDAAESLRMLLELHGHTVRVAGDGPAALKTIESFSPQIALLDLGLPGMGGVELAQQIRAVPGGERIRLIAVTGWGQDEDRQRTESVGFDEHLTKPIDVEELQRVFGRMEGG